MTEQPIHLKRTYTIRFTLAGIGFGLLFPIMATIIELSTNQIPVTLTSAWHLHSSNPLLWIIDTAPFFLGILASLVGIRQDNLLHSNEELHRRDLDLKSVQSSIEQQVQEQTRDLLKNSKMLERRANQLETVSSVAHSIAAVRDIEQLLTFICQVVSQQFGFYHTGIFLLDVRREYAVLRASNSPGGQHMLSRGHRLKVGEVGIVGYVCGKGEARIALDVGQDAVFFGNPDLPETHSEMALPLIASGKILGALDVQSIEKSAFSEDDISTLQILADQLAVAIENAYLFSENKTALEATRRLYSDISRSDWQNLIGERKTEKGYISLAGSDVLPIGERTSPEFLKTIKSGQTVLANEDTTLYLPIKVLNNVIGAIRLEKQKEKQWSVDEIATANNISEQLGTALESARLYNDISQRAEREQVISDITSKIGASIQLDTILRTAVEELGRIYNDSEIVLQLNQEKPGGKK